MLELFGTVSLSLCFWKDFDFLPLCLKMFGAVSSHRVKSLECQVFVVESGISWNKDFVLINGLLGCMKTKL